MAWATSTHRAAFSALSLKKGVSTPNRSSTQGSHSPATTGTASRRLLLHSRRRRRWRLAVSPAGGSRWISGRVCWGSRRLTARSFRLFSRRRRSRSWRFSWASFTASTVLATTSSMDTAGGDAGGSSSPASGVLGTSRAAGAAGAAGVSGVF